MWRILLYFIHIHTCFRIQTALAGPVVERRVRENVTLPCPPLEDNDDHSGIIWNKGPAQFVTVGKNQEVKYATDSLAERVTITSTHEMVMTNLELSDSGEYVCQIYVLKEGNWEPRETKHNLLVQDIPSAPGKPEARNIQPRQANITWASSSPNNSPVTAYIIYIRECQTNATVRQKTSYDSLEVVVDGLSPFTCYVATVSAVNSVGYSDPSTESSQFYTADEVLEDANSTTIIMDFNATIPTVATTTPNITLQPPAGAPLYFGLVNITSSEIELEWLPPSPEVLNGRLEGFEIGYGTSVQDMKSFIIEDTNRTSVVLQGLKPFTLYTVSIKAKNKAGTGPERAMEVETLEGLPSKPRITHINNQTPTSFYVNWEPPKEINGRLIKYELQWIYNEDVKSRYIAGHLINTMMAYISELSPYTGYKVQVAAVTNGGTGEFSDQFPALTDVAAPGAPRNLNVTELGPHSVHLSWEKPLVYYRTVDDYLIKGFDHRGRVIDVTVSGDVTRHTLSNLATNSRYHLKVAAITNAIFSPEKLVGDFTETIKIRLGAYEDRGSNVIWDKRSHVITDRTEESGIQPGTVAGIICGILLLVIVSVLVVGYRFYTCRKCYQAAYLYLAVPSNGQSVQQAIIDVEEPSEEKQYLDVDVTDFISHVRHMHMDGDIGFSQEFDEINRTSFSDKYPCDSSNMADNRNKNRYINIVAYDHSRVILKTELGRLRQSDYINANYVDGYKKPKAYIATQGPLPQTFPDFWRMVWEQNTNVIVMITNLMEKGRRKCDQYWPSDGAETYGNMNVKLITTVPRAHYTVRVFSLRNLKVKKRHSMKGVVERTVYHYHYTEWPDHGVPDYSLPVLSFVQKSAAQSGPEFGPIIVHCSAGVGRTGTYILIDSMIARIQDQRTINVPGFTQHIRRQRNFLVQTEFQDEVKKQGVFSAGLPDSIAGGNYSSPYSISQAGPVSVNTSGEDQYIFIHEVLVEYLLGNGPTEVKEEQLLGHLSSLEQPVRGTILPSITDTTLLERQYQLITEYTPTEADLSTALKPTNQEKNRVGSIIPVNMKRVLLPARPGIDGSDYINATYLQGYKKSAEFIVTQHPTEDTMEDFWRMVWDKNSPVIVVLSSFDDMEYKEFWPPKGSSIDVDSGNFRLAMKDEPVVNDEQGSITSEFILDSIQYDYTLMTRIVCFKDWPISCTELYKVFDAIVAVHDYVNSLECGPIIVMDRFGGVVAGTFCALWTLRDQILSEKYADFYQVCKLYHYKRPGIVGTQENYLFLHQAMAALSKHVQEEHMVNGSSPSHQHNSLHLGSIRRNGTLPRANIHTNNSGTAARSSVNMGRSNSGDSNAIATTPTAEGDKVETNI